MAILPTPMALQIPIHRDMAHRPTGIRIMATPTTAIRMDILRRAVRGGRRFSEPSSRATLIPWSTGMANLTIAVDEETLRRARIKALRQGSSVNQLLREYLESYAGGSSEQAAALRDILALSKNAKS